MIGSPWLIGLPLFGFRSLKLTAFRFGGGSCFVFSNLELRSNKRRPGVSLLFALVGV